MNMKLIKIDALPQVPTSHSGVGKKKVLLTDGEIPHLQQLGRVVFQPGDIVEKHSHTDFTELMYIEDGEGTMQVDDQIFSIGKGICIEVEPNESHTITVTGNTPLVLLFLGIYTQ